MQISNINRADSGIFSDQHAKLVYHQNDLTSFLGTPFDIEAFGQQIEKKSTFSAEQRDVLVDSLLNQYGELVISDSVSANIEALRDEKTFTVTTGHQLSLLTGPLYFVIKIAHVYKMTEKLKKQYPEYTFVPIYWMATEDHDYEEIQSMQLFGKKLEFDYEQRGPVGRFSLERFAEFKEEILQFFGEDRREEVGRILEAYNGKNLTEATRGMVNELFGHYGVVIIDGDDQELKRMFAPTIKKELSEQFSNTAVQATNQELEKEGVKLQVTSRPVNLFYIQDGLRERIIPEGDCFSIKGVGEFSLEELLAEVESAPERFSPNVILRPLYQELILPNLAYVGGGGEISYWLQLKGVFDQMECPYPLIQVRNSVIWIDRGTSKKMDKINFSLNDIFESADALKKRYVTENSSEDLDFSTIEAQLEAYQSLLKEQILKVDANLGQYAEVELKRLDKQMDAVRAKLIKTSKGKHDQAMKAIDMIKDRLFPGGGLQERSSNFLNFCADGQVHNWLNRLIDALAPFEKDLIVIREGENA